VKVQEAQLSQRDRVTHYVSRSLVNCYKDAQKNNTQKGLQLVNDPQGYPVIQIFAVG